MVVGFTTTYEISAYQQFSTLGKIILKNIYIAHYKLRILMLVIIALANRKATFLSSRKIELFHIYCAYLYLKFLWT
jgi:hypothetical protein